MRTNKRTDWHPKQKTKQDAQEEAYKLGHRTGWDHRKYQAPHTAFVPTSRKFHYGGRCWHAFDKGWHCGNRDRALREYENEQFLKDCERRGLQVIER